MSTTVALLTLECHKSGAWISKLVDSLHKLGEIEVILLPLESLLQDPQLNHDSLRRATVLVNRVSDAASPHLVKGGLATLYQAELLGIRVFNGPRAYALCSNKWCHHVLFDKAQLQSPTTIRVRTPIGDGLDNQELKRLIETHFEDTVQNFLLKPNSGGFGTGIVQFRRADILTTTVPIYEDNIGLIQQYASPQDGKIYRVWFLAGRVHCAVTRNVTDAADDEFSQGCVGFSCSRQQQQEQGSSDRTLQQTPRIQSYATPQQVVDEIEQRLLPLIPDADAGSVEYLVNAKGQRLYFDLNLLSTLPDTEAVDDIWGCDPWGELATAILQK